MKKLLFPLLVVVMSGCHKGSEETGADVGQMADLPPAARTTRVSTAVSQGERVRRVLRNLDTIEFRRSVIIGRVGEEESPQKQKAELVNAEISRLNEIIRTNKREIALLNDDLKDAGQALTGLSDSIMILNQRLAETESALEDMEDLFVETEEEYRVIENELYTMIAVNLAQHMKIQTLMDSAFKAYYVVAPEAELLKKGIIRKSGTLLSFSRPREIDPRTGSSGLVRIDQRKTLTIPINKGRARLVTSHPENSYRLVTEKNKVKRLLILNPSEFWKVSSYLVISAE